jgi:hypothetical protein
LRLSTKKLINFILLGLNINQTGDNYI